MKHKFFKKILDNKIKSILLLVLLFVLAYYFITKFSSNNTPNQYVVSTVQKGTVVNTISGSGQVSASNQVDVKFKASGEVLGVYVKNGVQVKAGTVLASLDAGDALKSIRDAQVSLETSKLSLDKLKQPADELTILQAENSLASAQESKQKSIDSLNKANEDALNSIANTFLDLPTIASDLYENLYGYEIVQNEKTLSSYQSNSDILVETVRNYVEVNDFQSLQSSTENDYKVARKEYDLNFSDYKNSSRYSNSSTISSLLEETINTVKSMAQSAKSENNYYDAWVDMRTKNNKPIFSQVKTYQSSISSDIGKINSHLSDLISIQQTIKNNELAIVDYDRTIQEKTISLSNLKSGPETTDLQSQELSIKQKENSLLDAKEKLADYSARAPFDGVVAKIDLKKGDQVSGGTVAATLITKQRTADITLNEVDVAKVKVGQKVTLTFDAVEGLSLTGEVAEVDSIGTVSQGVVNYNVKIVFDTQDDRVKLGMSVSASIITDIKQDVLTIPNSAIKTAGGRQYVEVPDEDVSDSSLNINSGIILKNPIKQQTVEVGLTNDTEAEITSGLNEGDKIIIRTIAASASKTATAPQGQSLFQVPRTAGGGGRNFGAGR